MHKMIEIVLGENAKIPTKGSKGAAGYDVFNAENEDYVLKPGERHAFSLNIKLSFPEDIYARAAPRSGHALKKGIDVLAGVCDSDYRDWYKIVLINLGQEEFKVKKGDKIAQIIFEKRAEAKFIQVDYLEDSDRGQNGFGSTGQ